MELFDTYSAHTGPPEPTVQQTRRYHVGGWKQAGRSPHSMGIGRYHGSFPPSQPFPPHFLLESRLLNPYQHSHHVCLVCVTSLWMPSFSSQPHSGLGPSSDWVGSLAGWGDEDACLDWEESRSEVTVCILAARVLASPWQWLGRGDSCSSRPSCRQEEGRVGHPHCSAERTLFSVRLNAEYYLTLEKWEGYEFSRHCFNL